MTGTARTFVHWFIIPKRNWICWLKWGWCRRPGPKRPCAACCGWRGFCLPSTPVPKYVRPCRKISVMCWTNCSMPSLTKIRTGMCTMPKFWTPSGRPAASVPSFMRWPTWSNGWRWIICILWATFMTAVLTPIKLWTGWCSTTRWTCSGATTMCFGWGRRPAAYPVSSTLFVTTCDTTTGKSWKTVTASACATL